MPCIDDLILTKRWASRPKDVLDINFLDSQRRVQEILADVGEKENIAALITWFSRRYPTVESRLRYVRKHARTEKKRA